MHITLSIVMFILYVNWLDACFLEVEYYADTRACGI
jgi:hypothetical protein